MANSYLTTGIAQGLEQARRRFRAEGQEDEDRKERKSELEYARGRRAVTDVREDETYDYGKERRGVEDMREDEKYTYDIEQRPLRERAVKAQVRGAELGTEAAELDLNYAREDRPAQTRMRDLGVKAAEHDFSDTKTRSARESELHRIQMEKISRQMQDEGLGRFVDALEGGADPMYAEKLFNAQGKNGIKPGTTRYDKKTGQISFTGAGGQTFNGSVEQLRALLPKASSAKPVVVGAGGSIYDPGTGTFRQPPNTLGGRGTGPNGQKLSPFNPQTHSKQTRDLVIQSLGGEWDNNLQKFKIPVGKSEKIAYATSLADQMIRMTSEEGLQLGPGEVNDVVVNVMREVRTTGEAEKIARTELGENAGQDAINERAQEIVEDSKIAAAQALGEELEGLRSNAQQQQNSASWPQAPDPSEDMEGGGEGMDVPPIEMLREGYVQQFQDGSKWTLENGKPVQVQ